MPILLTVFEPLGLSLGPELVQAMLLHRQRQTRRHLILVDLDTTGRLAKAVLPSLSPPLVELTVSGGLQALLEDPPTVKTLGHLRVDAGAYVYGGSCVELAWQQVVSAALTTGLALPAVPLLRSLLLGNGEGREVVVHAPLGMGTFTAALLAASDVVVMVVPKEVGVLAAHLAQKWVHRIGVMRGKSAPHLLARVVTSASVDPAQPLQSTRFDLDTEHLSGIKHVSPWWSMTGVELGRAVASKIWEPI